MKLKASVLIVVGLLIGSFLSSCNLLNEPEQPIHLKSMYHVGTTVKTPAGALTSNDPFRVIGMKQDNSSKGYSIVFDKKGYFCTGGNVFWIGGQSPYWPDGKIKIVIYYPVDATVDFDENCNLIQSNCLVYGESRFIDHFEDNLTIHLYPY